MDEAALRLAARRLVMESRAVEAYQVLEGAHVDVRVVKGLALESLLYDEGESRHYGDTDLLVNPAHWNRARRALGRIGYEPAPSGGLYEHPLHSVAFRRTGPAGSVSEIDLHHRFHSVRISSRAFWRVASADPVPITVDDDTVLTTNLATTGYHLVAAALADHGEARRVAEWRRFCLRFPDTVPEVRRVARTFRAEIAYDRGLAVIEGQVGEALPAAIPEKIKSMAVSAWLAHMRRAPSLRARVTLIREVLQDGRDRPPPTG